jgi:LSD1 subclass zinc finger protein
VGAAELPCATCGASMTLPSDADQVACPFCQAQVRRTGIR